MVINAVSIAAFYFSKTYYMIHVELLVLRCCFVVVYISDIFFNITHWCDLHKTVRDKALFLGF